MDRFLQQTLLVGSLALVYGSACALAGDEAAAGDAQEVLQRLVTTYPPGKPIPPDEFRKDAQVKRLSRLADRDPDSLLAAIELEKQLLVMNPQSFDQWKARPPVLLPGPARPTERTREAYQAYLRGVRRHEEERCRIDQKRRIVAMVLQVKAREKPDILLRLLEHKSIHVQDFAVRRVAPRVQRKEVVDALLKKLPVEYPWNDGGASRDEWIERKLPIAIVELLSAWQVPQALPHVRRLAGHPFYQYRRDSMRLVKRYGVQESVPHLIDLLNDETGVVRQDAFINLVLLTGTGLGQIWQVWGDDGPEAQHRKKDIAAWLAWWNAHGKAVPDVRFHREAVERAFALMDEHGAWDRRDSCAHGVAPLMILQEHLVSNVITREKRGETLVSELRGFWRQNQARLRFDDSCQKLVLPAEEIEQRQSEHF